MLLYLYLFMTGMTFASFVCCLSFRFVGHTSLSGRSCCDRCAHILNAEDLIPVLSFVLNRGRCRYCGERISPIYPASETIGGAVTCLLFLRYGNTAAFYEHLIFSFLLLGISLADIRYSMFSGYFVTAGLINRIFFLFLYKTPFKECFYSFIRAFFILVSLLFLSKIMSFFLKKEAIGEGDIELLTITGFYFPCFECLLIIMLAALFGISSAFLFYRNREEIPFCPCICMAVFIVIIFRL